MSNRSLTGAAALLAAPLAIIAAALIIPTLSDEATDQVAALDHHRTAMLTGMTLQMVTVVLFIAGAVWLALTVGRHAPRLAYAGGVLAVGGGLLVLFVDAMHVAVAAATLHLGAGQATLVADRILSSRVVTIVEPLQMLQDLGFVLLATAVAKAGAPKWAATAIAIGAVGEAAGFGAESRAVVAVAFAVMLAGLVPAVRTLTGGRTVRRAPAVQPAAA